MFLTYSFVQHFSLSFPPFSPFIHLFLISSKFITSLKLIITAWMYIYVYTNIFPTTTYSVTCWHVLRIVWYCTANRYAVPWKRPLLFLDDSRKCHHFYISNFYRSLSYSCKVKGKVVNFWCRKSFCLFIAFIG